MRHIRMVYDKLPFEIEKGLQPVAAGTMRGDPALKDWYFFGGITLAYRFIPNPRCPDVY